MELIDHIVVAANGTSLFARIPASLAKVMSIEKGTILNLYKDGNRVVYEKESPNDKP